MIFTYSIISGFRAILGSIGIQSAMLFVTYFFVKPPTQPYTEEPSPGDNELLANKMNILWWYICGTHLYCTQALFATQFAREDWF
jgi:hypothetical protein